VKVRRKRTRASARWLGWLDTVFFVLAGVLSVWLASLTLQEGITPGWQSLLLVVFWVLVAYLVLPRVHRILTQIYLPDYFIGRTRTADGLLGDPVNLALMGSADQVHQGMADAGWVRADDVSFVTGWRIVTRTLARRSYPEAPVSPLLLFRRRQDFAYQQEVAGSPSKRHHIRFWKCPPGWLLPGGFAVDWLAAGTFDRSVGLSLFTLQVTHKIDQDTDAERDHVVATVTAANPAARVGLLSDFATGYHSRNGGGDRIRTDGDLPILDLSTVAAESKPATVEPGAPRRQVPGQTVFGVAVTALRGVSYLLLGWAASAYLASGPALPAEDLTALELGWILLVGLGLADLGLAIAVYLGSNGARLLLSALSLWSAAMVAVARWLEHNDAPLHLDLVPLAISVLVLLALSSEAARGYAMGRRADESAAFEDGFGGAD
jgi:hypothetical protein